MSSTGGDDEVRETIGLLLDRQQIADCLLRYSRGLDRHDLDLARSCFHDDAIVEYPNYRGPAAGLVELADQVHREEYGNHQLYLSNSAIELGGDAAHAETYFMVAALRRGTLDSTLSGGRYVDRLERRAEWRVAARICTVEWVDDPQGAEAMAEANPFFSRDRDDPSWRRPLQVQAGAPAAGGRR